MEKELVSIGMWDINDIRLTIGHATLSENAEDKFVIAENRTDRQGQPIHPDTFDVRTMCYSLFMVPQHAIKHAQIPAHIAKVLKQPESVQHIGRIVGGGQRLIDPVQKNILDLYSRSTKFGREPAIIRNQMLALLKDHLQNMGHSYEVLKFTHAKNFDAHQAWFVHPYWLRFRQIVEQLKPMLRSRDFEEKERNCIQGTIGLLT